MALITGLGIVTQSCDRDEKDPPYTPEPPQPKEITVYFVLDSVVYDPRDFPNSIANMERFSAFKTIIKGHVADSMVSGINLFPRPGSEWTTHGTTQTGRVVTGLRTLHNIDPENIFGGGEEMKFDCITNNSIDDFRELGYTARLR